MPHTKNTGEDVRTALQARFVEVADHCIPRIDPESGDVDLPGAIHRQIHVCYPLAYLYVTDFPGNRHYRREATLRAAIAAAEYRFRYQTERGGFDSDDEKEQGDEWQAYFLIRAAEVLGRDALSAERWEAWVGRVARYVDCHGSRGFFYSAPNHDCWKCTTIDLAGRVFARPEWCELAGFQMGQLLRYQLGPGYWDENRHHGPSMSYNHTMSVPLYLFWKATGREDVSAALDRLLDFMIRYSQPDGSFSGALDGRMHARPGRLNPAMSLSPQGRRLNRLSWENWVSATVAPGRPVEGDIGAAAAWQLDHLRFAGEGPETAIGPESDGHLVLEHDGNFHALARRQGAWHVTLSGIFSDIPKESDNVYRMTRQSRIDLWHERCGLLLGGGSLHRSASRQLANLFVDTGYFADVDFGAACGRFEDCVRATFFPRLAAVRADGPRSSLELTFAHAQGRFELLPVSETEFRLDFYMQSAGVRRAYACLPLVVWAGSQLRVDGKAPGDPVPAQSPVASRVEITGSRRGASWEILVPPGAEARLNAPFTPIFAHRQGVRQLKEDDYYEVALLAVRVPPGAQAGPLSFVVRAKGG